MATTPTGLIDIGTLTDNQRNQLVFELLNYDADTAHNVRHSPTTEVGKATLEDFQYELISDLNDGEIGERLSEALMSWEADLDDSIWFIMDHHIPDISEELVSAVATALVTGLAEFEVEIRDFKDSEGASTFRNQHAPTSNGQLDHETMRKLESSLSIALPDAVSDALRIDFDTRELKKAIWSVCRTFMYTSVVADAAQGICEAEATLASFSASSHRLNGPTEPSGAISNGEAEDADHG